MKKTNNENKIMKNEKNQEINTKVVFELKEKNRKKTSSTYHYLSPVILFISNRIGSPTTDKALISKIWKLMQAPSINVTIGDRNFKTGLEFTQFAFDLMQREKNLSPEKQEKIKQGIELLKK